MSGKWKRTSKKTHTEIPVQEEQTDITAFEAKLNAVHKRKEMFTKLPPIDSIYEPEPDTKPPVVEGLKNKKTSKKSTTTAVEQELKWSSLLFLKDPIKYIFPENIKYQATNLILSLLCLFLTYNIILCARSPQKIPKVDIESYTGHSKTIMTALLYPFAYLSDTIRDKFAAYTTTVTENPKSSFLIVFALMNTMFHAGIISISGIRDSFIDSVNVYDFKTKKWTFPTPHITIQLLVVAGVIGGITLMQLISCMGIFTGIGLVIYWILLLVASHQLAWISQIALTIVGVWVFVISGCFNLADFSMLYDELAEPYMGCGDKWYVEFPQMLLSVLTKYNLPILLALVSSFNLVAYKLDPLNMSVWISLIGVSAVTATIKAKFQFMVEMFESFKEGVPEVGAEIWTAATKPI